MKKIFDSYGKYYDIIYGDKNYQKECDFLEEIFQRHSKFKIRSLLDAGCGTGGHAIPLALRGYAVTGIDLSGEMICIAKEKASRNGTKIDFSVMDLRELKLDKSFDAAICMFAVINYLTKDKDLSKALSNIRNHIKESSLFIFDFWYGPAVLAISPTPRMKTIKKDGVKVVRFAEPRLERSTNLCEVNYYFIVIKEHQVLYEGKEKHTVRFYFPKEIRRHLEESNFRLLKLCPFLELDGAPNEGTWNVAAIAQAI